LKEKFIEKMFSQFKTVKKAFTEMNKERTPEIGYDIFKENIMNWGFDVPEHMIEGLYRWLDHDKDGKISFEDLRQTAGKETNPMEQLFFRQDVKRGQVITCKYEKCWENNSNNSNSQYCPLHQKILRNRCFDKCSQISQALDESKWQSLLAELE